MDDKTPRLTYAPHPSELRKHFERLKVRRFLIVAGIVFMALEVVLVALPATSMVQACSSTTTSTPAPTIGLRVSERVERCSAVTPTPTAMIVVAALVGFCLLVEVLTLLPPFKVETPAGSVDLGQKEDVASIDMTAADDKSRYKTLAESAQASEESKPKDQPE